VKAPRTLAAAAVIAAAAAGGTVAASSPAAAVSFTPAACRTCAAAAPVAHARPSGPASSHPATPAPSAGKFKRWLASVAAWYRKLSPAQKNGVIAVGVVTVIAICARVFFGVGKRK